MPFSQRLVTAFQRKSSHLIFCLWKNSQEVKNTVQRDWFYKVATCVYLNCIRLEAVGQTFYMSHLGSRRLPRRWY